MSFSKYSLTTLLNVFSFVTAGNVAWCFFIMSYPSLWNVVARAPSPMFFSRSFNSSTVFFVNDKVKSIELIPVFLHRPSGPPV